VGYAISDNYGSVGNCFQSTGTGTTFANCPYIVQADSTQTIVNGNVTTPQVLETHQFLAGTLNYVGASFRLRSHIDEATSGSGTGTITFQEGTTTGLTNSQTVNLAGSNSALSFVNAAEITCLVQVAGSSGQMVCSPLSQVTTASGVQAFALETIISVDFTSSFYVGTACTFSAASTSNTCRQALFVLERLQ
jgi:hypothetical protein